jgi:hypothetical protein
MPSCPLRVRPICKSKGKKLRFETKWALLMATYYIKIACREGRCRQFSGSCCRGPHKPAQKWRNATLNSWFSTPEKRTAG